MNAPAPTDAAALREALATEIGNTVLPTIKGLPLRHVLKAAVSAQFAAAMLLRLVDWHLARAATTDAALARALDESSRLKAALKLCLAELDWQTEQAKHCGDPNYECPMQDIHNPDDGHLLARNAALAALTDGGFHA